MDTLVQATVNGLALGAQYALLALGFSLVFGVLGVINFAHGAFYVLGGYFTYSLMTGLGLPYALALIAAVLGVAAVGYVMELLLIEKIVDNHEGTLIVSLGFYFVVIAALTLFYGPEAVPVKFPVDSVLRLEGFYIPVARLIVIAVSAVAVLGLWFLLYRSKHGIALRALSENRDVATMQGLRPRVYFPLAVALSAALAGLAGGLVTPIFTLEPPVGEAALMVSFLVVVLGGLGSLIGAASAAIGVGLVEAIAGTYLDGSLTRLLLFVIVLALLIFRPSGIAGRSLRDA